MSDIEIEIDCFSTFPLMDALTKAFEQIGDMASQLWDAVLLKLTEMRQALLNGLTALYNQLLSELQPLIDAYNDFVDTIKQIWAIISPFPISAGDPMFPSIDYMLAELPKRARALISEFTTFLLQQILELIATLIPIDFNIPVPFFGTVNIIDFFSDAEYRAQLKAQLVEQIDDVLGAIPNAIANIYAGIQGGVESLEMRAQEIWQWFVQQINKAGIELLYSAIEALIDKFKEIWDSLGLPDLIALLTLDVEGLIESAINLALDYAEDYIQEFVDAYNNIKALYQQGKATLEDLQGSAKTLKDAAKSKWQIVIDYVLDIEVFGIAIRDMVDTFTSASVENAEEVLAKLISQAKDWAYKFVLKKITEWIAKVAKFFEAIGLGAILDLLTLNLCDFFAFIGLPVTKKQEDNLYWLMNYYVPLRFDGGEEQAG